MITDITEYNMTKDQIVEQIAEETGLTKLAALTAVEGFMRCVSQAVAKGNTVYLRGFGKFYSVVRKAKSVRNFKTQKNYTKNEYKCPKFRPYDSFIESVADGHSEK